MIALWPHWLRPLWLVLLPLLLWLLWQLWHRQRRAGRWQMLLPAAFHKVLLSGGNRRVSRLPWIALGLSWLLGLLALLGPSWQHVEQSTQKRADPLVVMLDLTPSMLAGDVQPNRLEHAKHKVLDLLEARHDAQTAIVLYAGSAHTLVPLSDDLGTARNLLESLKPAIMPEAGRRADLAVAKALTLLEQGSQGQGRLLLITSALDDQERQGIRQALGKHGNRLQILGIGSAQGAPIAQEGGGFLKDAQGSILLPRLDSAGLRRFANELGGNYLRSRLDESDLRDLGLLEDTESLRDSEPTQLETWADQGYWLLLPLLLLAACAGRRGWLFCLPLLLMIGPRPSYAFEFTDLWLRADQQGERLLQQHKAAEAADTFSDPKWQGQALYQAGDYAGAANRFATGNSAADHYNRGNALARSGELEAALDAYDQALERQPELPQALANKALVEELLRQQQQQQKQQEKQQKNQQQGKNQQQKQAEQNPGSDTDNPQQPPPSAANKPGEQDQPQDSQQAGQQGAKQDADAAKPSDQAGGNRDDKSAKGEHSEDGKTQAEDGQQQHLGAEQRQAMEQWLRQIPDDPGELLRRKFWYEQQQRQEPRN
ncbi:Ca-activated chloride channel family protein [Pseudomonas sp. TE3786]